MRALTYKVFGNCYFDANIDYQIRYCGTYGSFLGGNSYISFRLILK